MTHPSVPEFAPALVSDLLEYLGHCEQALAIAGQESRALTGSGDYQPFAFHQRRKDLLSGLESSLTKLRGWRQTWQQTGVAERASCSEVKPLFQAIQDMLMKVLLLDRENQQALLRRGLVPSKHLTLATGHQQPHYVANLYRRNGGS
jgi:hypothetical protein